MQLIIAFAVGPTVAAHGLYISALKHVPASNASIMSTWEPATAVILAFLLLGETLVDLGRWRDADAAYLAGSGWIPWRSTRQGSSITQSAGQPGTAPLCRTLQTCVSPRSL